jgi:hypothetical protein
MLVLDSHMPLEQLAELEGAEVDGPDPITDLLKAHVFADANRGDVHPAAVPANATVGADVADFEAVGILEWRAAGLPMLLQTCARGTRRPTAARHPPRGAGDP